MDDQFRNSRRYPSCPSCRKPLDSEAHRCNHCGWKVWYHEPEKVWLAVIVALALIVFYATLRHDDAVDTSDSEAMKIEQQRHDNFEHARSRRR